jgi:hypothetical protein
MLSSSRPRSRRSCPGKALLNFMRFYGESYKLPQTQAIIEARVEALGENIVMMAKSMNSNIFNFLGPEVCSKNIWTQGYPFPKQGNEERRRNVQFLLLQMILMWTTVIFSHRHPSKGMDDRGYY